MPVFVADEQDVEVDTDDLLSLLHHVVAARDIPTDMELSLLLVDRDTIEALNREHLDGDGPTDVLAFPIDAVDDDVAAGAAVLGDVVLCPAVAVEQAERLGRDPVDEMRMLTVHGVLHLLGMDHAQPQEEAAMVAATDEVLRSYAPEAAQR